MYNKNEITKQKTSLHIHTIYTKTHHTHDNTPHPRQHKNNTIIKIKKKKVLY